MITISTNEVVHFQLLCDSFQGQIKFVNECQSSKSDLFVKSEQMSSYDAEAVKPNQVTVITDPRVNVDRRLIKPREGFCVDNRIPNIPSFNNFCFTQNDFCDIPYLIPMPMGPRFGRNNRKPIKNTTFNNKVFWSGSLTHSTRNDFLKFYKTTIDDIRFDISLFQEKVYQNGLKDTTYEAYLDALSKSDIVFLLRGDRIWASTFFDILQTGCIPVMISSMNDYGWENLLENVDDYMLRFDAREHSLSHIHQQVVSLLEDKERVLYMKANIKKLYDMFFLHSNIRYGFSEFFLAKCVEIYKNDFDINKIDEKFICPEILNLKGLDHKL